MSNEIIPAYRIYCIPVIPSRDLINTLDIKVQQIVKRPPRLRPNSFGYRGLSEIRPTPEGIKGVGVTADQELVLLKNGYIELNCPLRNRLFQWKKEDYGYTNMDWLYPYAVAEMPASFLRMAKALYELAKVRGKIQIGQEYRNIKGFILVSGHPSNPFFKFNENDFKDDHIVCKPNVVDELFDENEAARTLIEEVYRHFGFDRENVPEITEAWSWKEH